MKLKLRVLSAVCAVAVGCLGSMAVHAEKQSVAERTAPVGEVCMAGEACAASVSAVGGTQARSAESIYNSKCMTCHATGAAGAPKLDDTATWASRLADRQLAGLYDSAITGFQGMPAKGLCMDCSDEELQDTVDYMLTQAGVEPSGE